MTQLETVRTIMLDGEWHTLRNLVKADGLTSFTEGSVASRIRDLRTKGHKIEKHYNGHGEFAYRLVAAPIAA